RRRRQRRAIARFALPETGRNRLLLGRRHSRAGASSRQRGRRSRREVTLPRMSEAPPYSAATVDVVPLPGAVAGTDGVAVEEPLEIRINGESVAVTMRPPGHDEELALGFCLSEGLAPTSAAPALDLAVNTIEVTSGAFDPARLRRNFYTSSSCAFV